MTGRLCGRRYVGRRWRNSSRVDLESAKTAIPHHKPAHRARDYLATRGHWISADAAQYSNDGAPPALVVRAVVMPIDPHNPLVGAAAIVGQTDAPAAAAAGLLEHLAGTLGSDACSLWLLHTADATFRVAASGDAAFPKASGSRSISRRYLASTSVQAPHFSLMPHARSRSPIPFRTTGGL